MLIYKKETNAEKDDVACTVCFSLDRMKERKNRFLHEYYGLLRTSLERNRSSWQNSHIPKYYWVNIALCELENARLDWDLRHACANKRIIYE